MRAIILAGGYGTRLKPLTNHIPKPMVHIIDKPLLEYTLSLMREHGIRDIIVTIGYKGEYIMDYFGNGSEFGVRLRYMREDTPLGTAGAVKNAEELLDDDFIVMSGDALTDINITELMSYHREHGGLVTMATTSVDDVSGYGVVETEHNGHIRAFREKTDAQTSGTVNMGIYAMNRRALSYIPYGTKYDFSLDLFPHILSYMYAYFSHSYWSDIGTLSSYYLTNNYVVTEPERFGISL